MVYSASQVLKYHLIGINAIAKDYQGKPIFWSGEIGRLLYSQSRRPVVPERLNSLSPWPSGTGNTWPREVPARPGQSAAGPCCYSWFAARAPRPWPNRPAPVPAWWWKESRRKETVSLEDVFSKIIYLLKQCYWPHPLPTLTHILFAAGNRSFFFCGPGVARLSEIRIFFGQLAKHFLVGFFINLLEGLFNTVVTHLFFL